ncbi:hypothetical protein E2320_014309 [Naja naja]|nr:hypothetical protein E2320_014309 [Naja naja]
MKHFTKVTAIYSKVAFKSESLSSLTLTWGIAKMQELFTGEISAELQERGNRCSPSQELLLGSDAMEKEKQEWLMSQPTANYEGEVTFDHQTNPEKQESSHSEDGVEKWLELDSFGKQITPFSIQNLGNEELALLSNPRRCIISHLLFTFPAKKQFCHNPSTYHVPLPISGFMMQELFTGEISAELQEKEIDAVLLKNCFLGGPNLSHFSRSCSQERSQQSYRKEEIDAVLLKSDAMEKEKQEWLMSQPTANYEGEVTFDHQTNPEKQESSHSEDGVEKWLELDSFGKQITPFSIQNLGNEELALLSNPRRYIISHLLFTFPAKKQFCHNPSTYHVPLPISGFMMQELFTGEISAELQERGNRCSPSQELLSGRSQLEPFQQMQELFTGEISAELQERGNRCSPSQELLSGRSQLEPFQQVMEWRM